MVIITYLTFFALALSNIVSGIMKKRSNFLYAFAFLVIFILMTFNYKGPDIEVYISTYKLIGNAPNLHSAIDLTYMENGYTFLTFCANKVGLDFFAFRIILSVICLSLFASTIRYYKANPNFIVGLYMIYVFFFDTIQLRNCVVQFIILFATRYLFKKSGLSILKYVLCVGIAASFHVLAWIYISLLLIRFLRKKSYYQTLFFISAVIFIVFILLRPLLPQILNAVSNIINRGGSYLHSELRFNYLVIMALNMLALMPLYLYKNRIRNSNIRNKLDVILRIEIIMGLFLPFTFINSNFNRIFRNMLILNTIGLTLLYENTKKYTKPNSCTLAAQILLTAGWLATDLFRNRDGDIVNAIMKYNLIFDKIVVPNIWEYLFVAVLCLLLVYLIKHYVARRKKSSGMVILCNR